jgi:hypothetical protein
MFNEIPDVFLADFGVPVTAGNVSGVGILDMPTQIVADGMVLTTEYALTAKTSDFGHLVYGAAITVNSETYEVREVRKLDDGQFCEISLSLATVSLQAVFSQDVFTAGVFVS